MGTSSDRGGVGGKEQDIRIYGHRVRSLSLAAHHIVASYRLTRLTVANEMLSLLGSLQPDPFSPLHTISHEHPGTEEQEASESEEDVEGSESDESEDESEEDTLQSLGKRKAVIDLSSQNVRRVKT